MSIKIEIHGIEQSGTCSLSGKDGEVLLVSFSDGTVNESALSLKSFIQLLRMKLGQKPAARTGAAKSEAGAEPKPGNGVLPVALPARPQ